MENLKFLRYGKLPPFQLTEEAREVFWKRNTVQVLCSDLDFFSLGIRLFSYDLYPVPRKCVRKLRVDIHIDHEDVPNHDVFWVENLYPALRQLIDFPTLQNLEIAVCMQGIPNCVCLTKLRVNQIKHICVMLMKKYGKGLAVFNEMSAHLSNEDEPYPWETQAEVEQNSEDGASQNDVLGEIRETTAKEGIDQEILGTDAAAATDSQGNHEPEDADRQDTDRIGQNGEGEPGTAIVPSCDNPDDGSVTFQRQDLTWLWMSPTEKTLAKIAKGGDHQCRTLRRARSECAWHLIIKEVHRRIGHSGSGLAAMLSHTAVLKGLIEIRGSG